MSDPVVPVHLSAPREGIPPLADTASAVREVADALADGRGPVAVDTERASGFRFDDRAYLVQVRRSGSGTHLIDPAQVPSAGEILAPVMNRTPWILHAGHSDLPALTTLGWRTPQLNDTQIAGRLLGFGQVGLAGMLESLLGVTVAKDKGREDWSARPIPDDLLSYAALDVELLIELLETALARLQELGRQPWYLQECEHVRSDWSYPVRPPNWRKLRGIGAVRDRRGLEIARQLTDVRTGIARARDIPPEKVLRSSAILDLAKNPRRAAQRLPREIATSSRLARSQRRGRSRQHLEEQLSRAVQDALSADADTLPETPRVRNGHPDHRHWERDYPRAHAALVGFRAGVDDLVDSTGIRAEDLIVARNIRSVAWDITEGTTGVQASFSSAPPSVDPVGDIEELLGGLLEDLGCRDWQIDLLVPVFLPVVVDLPN